MNLFKGEGWNYWQSFVPKEVGETMTLLRQEEGFFSSSFWHEKEGGKMKTVKVGHKRVETGMRVVLNCK